MKILEKIQTQFNNVNANISMLASFIQELAQENQQIKEKLNKAEEEKEDLKKRLLIKNGQEKN